MPQLPGEASWTHRLLLLSTAAGVRAFTIGLTGVVLGIHLGRLGYSASEVGLVVGAGLGGNAAATALLTRFPGRLDNKSALIATTLLASGGLLATAFVSVPGWLALCAFAGLLNGMGRDRGPAQVIEQSLLADGMPVEAGAATMARYTAVQDVAGGVGSLAAGLPDLVSDDPVRATRFLLACTALLMLATLAIYVRLLPRGPGVGSVKRELPRPSLPTRRRVRGLAGLFALDSLGGGFLAGSILSYWFFVRFGLGGATLGPLFFAARVLNAASYFGAEHLSRRIGLIRTMVFTHLPSSAFLLFLPWTTSAGVAIGLFLAREALVQMDVPARQAFVALVTSPGERVYAFGLTGLARNVGWAVGPGLAGWSAQLLGLGTPLIVGAGLKMCYDLALYRSWKSAEVASLTPSPLPP